MMKAQSRHSAGFTLVELLFVMVIIALVLGFVATSISRSISGAESRVAARKVAASLRYTRAQAILNKQQTVFMVNTEERSYQAPGKQPVKLPEGMDMLLTTARSEFTSENVGGIRFFPDGGSPGGYIQLIVNGREYRVNVAWLTGEASLQKPDEPT